MEEKVKFLELNGRLYPTKGIDNSFLAARLDKSGSLSCNQDK